MPRNPCITRLNQVLRAFYKTKRRILPWRKTRDPYKILVSEIMLQQTQVERVVPKYESFLARFPSAQALAAATLPQVLRHWQGLGYNRRGKLLRDAARIIMERHMGKFPRRTEEIDALPGVGPYTARAVAAFAFNKTGIFIETNIRTVFIHHCFGDRAGIADAEILPLIEQALKRSRMTPRDFYSALMDYGSFLKRSGVKLNARSKHYAKQPKFEGSPRQLRGQILKVLLRRSHTIPALVTQIGRPAADVRREVARLQKEGLIMHKKAHYSISRS